MSFMQVQKTWFTKKYGTSLDSSKSVCLLPLSAWSLSLSIFLHGKSFLLSF